MQLPPWLSTYVKLMRGGNLGTTLTEMGAAKGVTLKAPSPAATSAYEAAVARHQAEVARVTGAYAGTGAGAGIGLYGTSKLRDDPTVMERIRRTRIGKLIS